MSERIRRSSRLRENLEKRKKLIAKVTKKKTCKIRDSSSSSDSADDEVDDRINDSATSNNASTTGYGCRSGSLGGNFTRM